MIIRSRAPVRVEFGGGGTDLPKFFENDTGYVLNATINKYVYGTLKPKHTTDLRIIASEFKSSKLFNDVDDGKKFDDDVKLVKEIISSLKLRYGVDLFLRSDIPPNTGLGSGATVAVSVIGLFNHLKYEKGMNNYEIAEYAYRINNLNNSIPGGKQCQYSSVFGGINFLEFNKDYTRVHNLKLKRSTLLELEKNLILAYVGKRPSLDNVTNLLTEQQKTYSDREKLLILYKLRDIAIEMKCSLVRNDLNCFGEKLGEAFELKKKLNPLITNQQIEDIYKMARKFGALGGRVIGAGAGGHMLFYCESNKEQQVASRLQEAGIGIIDFSFTDNGLETWEVNS
ncbi:GHMP kinase [Candidatus Woesearchaeota archaeon]|nr:MAG: GHMP kinase [Candidatus Woesearchaeota archaeon]